MRTNYTYGKVTSGEWEKFGSNAVDLFLGDDWFEYWLGHQLTYIKGFVGFLSYSRQVPE
jgi:hypothetical protein